MKRIEIEILPSGTALKAFKDVWRRASAGKSVTPRIAFGSVRELYSTLSEKRIALLRYVGAHPGLNTRQISNALGRDYKNVHGDVSDLLDIGLLQKDARGRITAPFDEIIIRARTPRAAPKAA
jgi:predicted transcriptional regulator